MEAIKFIQCLLDLSEQASNLACLIRNDEELFKLLVASKEQRLSGEPDFKTLADVLIQSTFKYGLDKKFPKQNITVMGEEDGTFPTKTGGHVRLDITDDLENTRTLLRTVLHDDKVVEKLCNAIHCSVSVHDDILAKIRNVKLPADLTIWIDPIDSTSSYISGSNKLDSVTVLVGAYHQGVPIVGVMTYPFSKDQIWGLCYEGYSAANVPAPAVSSPIKSIVLSSVESADMVDKLRSCGYHTESPAGAGYKLGAVIKGTASFYMVTYNSTYQWDTCGPHAILRALGGDIVFLSEPTKPLKYSDNRAPNDGFIAYIDAVELKKLVDILQ